MASSLAAWCGRLAIGGLFLIDLIRWVIVRFEEAFDISSRWSVILLF
jgi:hypothetical protein